MKKLRLLHKTSARRLHLGHSSLKKLEFTPDSSNKAVSQFFNELEPILAKHHCAMVLVHHTVKQSKLSRQNQVDTSYAGYGSAVWSNSVRDTLEISSTNIDGRYVIKAGKRSSKLGWKEMYIKRSNDPMLPYWSTCNPGFFGDHSG